ncbi:YjbF family lipoprotein [Aliidiomarina sedimenti]|uniref:YjbF family lipoprotein n=2 Tax=Aliidiomarina sedimenti TaxID=1933879 RepID=A0ABY0BZJ5_9GAMM|nr:YjbF family lipoprotein [Aliidiomarina sedimenti]
MAGLVTAIVGCTAVTEETRATLEYAFSKPDDVQLSADEINDFPYTALYAKWDDSAQILIVLGYIDSGEYNWVSADRETMVTVNGRVVRTAGVDYELMAVSNLSQDPLQCVVTAPANCALSWQRQIDIGTEDSRYTRSVRSEFRILGDEVLQLPSGEYQVTRVEEHGTIGSQKFHNTFWIEADGHVVKSRQLIVPERKLLELTQVKWVGR